MNKLLIVDDSSTMRKIIMRTLKQAGIVVECALEAANGVEALEHLRTDSEIGLVLCDVNMPDMGGIELVQKLREFRDSDDLPVIMISAEGGDAKRAEALSWGANAYVAKPFTPQAIITTLGPYLD